MNEELQKLAERVSRLEGELSRVPSRKDFLFTLLGSVFGTVLAIGSFFMFFIGYVVEKEQRSFERQLQHSKELFELNFKQLDQAIQRESEVNQNQFQKIQESLISGAQREREEIEKSLPK